ncbi:uncharacterized protein LOC111867628 isoform X1 [Cryptotermes secundus]|uniref:uncharacterized protein LOC111867628 isoform X1 n=1 Tax=Cryptotermes secundus TaxID=105785 RepID=UPI000CD7DC0B|nr:uncharacterized protein LOC111867628 isoform X1 [Cryptotermes secundus]
MHVSEIRPFRSEMPIEDPIVQCQYDPSHSVLKSRLQMHLVKCSRNHPLANKAICPFNAVHHVDKPNYQYHINNCPDRRVIEGYKYELEDSEHGDLAETPYHQPSIPPDEDTWEAETPVPMYNPQQYAEAAPVLRKQSVAPKSEKRAFSMRERQRIQNLKEGITEDHPSAASSSQSGSSVTVDGIAPLRLPRETSQALRLLDPSMGLGRGIIPHRTEEATPGHSSLAEHSGLGLGRGASVNVELPMPIGIGRGKPL